MSVLLQMQLEEQSNMIAEMESALEAMNTDLDRRLTEQQQQYEDQINTLLQKISEKDEETHSQENTTQYIK